MQHLITYFICFSILMVTSTSQAVYFSDTPSINIDSNSDPEKIINTNDYPWRTVGGLSLSKTDRYGCTVVLVGPDLALNNGHCPINKETGKLRSESFYVSFNPKGKRYNTDSSLMGPRFKVTEVIETSGTWKTSSEGGDKSNWKKENDWVLMRIEKPIGYKLGWMGIINSKGEILPGFEGESSKSKPNFSAEDLCTSETSPYPMFAKEQEKVGKDRWAYPISNDDDYDRLPKFCQLGFPQNYPGYDSDEIKHDMILSHSCHNRGTLENVFATSCGNSEGGSGSPMFYIHPHYGPLMVGLANSTTKERTKTPGPFVLGEDSNDNNAHYTTAVKSDQFFEQVKNARKANEFNLRLTYDADSDSRLNRLSELKEPEDQSRLSR